MEKHAALADVGIRVRDGLVHFTSVPAAAMKTFLAVLGKVEW